MTIKPVYIDRESTAMAISVSVNTMETMVQRGLFPKPRQITEKRVGWLVREVEEWAESRPVSSNLPVANSGRKAA